MVTKTTHHALHENSIPFFWPFTAAAALAEGEWRLFNDNLKFPAEAEKIDHELKSEFATPNAVVLALHTLQLRDFSRSSTTTATNAVPTLVDAPYAGHSATIADYHQGQSLVKTLLDNGLERVLVTDWNSATPLMKDYDIGNCATVGPGYRAPELNPPIQWSGETGSRISADPLDPMALNRWWTTLQDPLLSRLIDRALAGNLSLRDAEARLREARAQRGVSAADQFPTLGASASATRSRLSETSYYEGTSFAGATNTLYQGGFDASWEVHLFGRIQRQTEAASTKPVVRNDTLSH